MKNKLIEKLNEIFHKENEYLDFGIYRIINKKREVIDSLIEKEIPNYIDKSIENSYFQKKEKIDLDIYEHLIEFFSRYYKNGDFITQRRGAYGQYLIPYFGEEVKLHWANEDQYYIKSTEDHSNYSFVYEGVEVNFKLINLESERDNNKGNRKFYKIIQDKDIINPSVKGNRITFYFEHSSAEKGTQKSFNKETLTFIEHFLKHHEHSSFYKSLKTDYGMALMEKELSKYTAKNTRDYFIHRNLKDFLKQELDFYIKNDVVDIYDLTEDTFRDILEKSKIIKVVGESIINLLSQFEDFQKKIWEKKKLVINSGFCITLDKVDISLYQEILENEQQLAEWEEMFNISIKDINNEYLLQNQALMIDTKYFNSDFIQRLLTKIHNIDEETIGWLFNADNFQALNFMKSRFNKDVQTVYIVIHSSLKYCTLSIYRSLLWNEVII